MLKVGDKVMARLDARWTKKRLVEVGKIVRGTKTQFEIQTTNKKVKIKKDTKIQLGTKRDVWTSSIVWEPYDEEYIKECWNHNRKIDLSILFRTLIEKDLFNEGLLKEAVMIMENGDVEEYTKDKL